MCCVSACAEEVSIQASFKPDSGNPQRNQFKNDTVPSGYCASYPKQCLDNSIFSLRVPIQFDSTAPILANHTNSRQGAMIQVPTQWRDLTVFHETTGEPETVKIRIAGIGSTYQTEDVIQLVGGGDDYRAAHNQLWGYSWVNAPPSARCAAAMKAALSLSITLRCKYAWACVSSGSKKPSRCSA